MKDLCQTGHPSHTYVSGTAEFHTNYIDVDMVSTDAWEHTKEATIRVMKGAGGIYFSDFTVLSDDAVWLANTFEAFGYQSQLMVSLLQIVDQNTYVRIRNWINSTFNTDLENWTGKMWALLAINLDYYQYLLTGR